jgi:hypothetical protein
LAAAALAAAALVLAVSGGFRTTVGGIRISARSPVPIAVLAAAAGSMWAAAARRQNAITGDLEDAWQSIERHALRIVVAVAVAAGLVAAVFATRSAAGADASGYVSEAAMLMSGDLFHVDDLFDATTGHDPFLTSPLGWRPAPSGVGQSPTYPPGLPMLMAVPQAIGGVTGASAVVIASAIIAVIATGMIARQLGGPIAGIIAASLLAFTPVFLYQSIQPMSDVPVTAAWTLCFLFAIRQRSLAAGIACGFAVLIRPNLAPLAVVPLYVASNRLAFASPVAIAGATLAGLQWVWYGSPLRSGYGSTDELFAVSNIGPNAQRYVTWLMSTAPVFALCVFGFARMRAHRAVQALAAFSVLVIAAYLVYAVFDDWSYLRFLLPAMAAFAVLAAIALAAWIDRVPRQLRAVLLFAAVVGVTCHALSVARSKETFRLADQLRRVQQVGDFVKDSVGRTAVLIAGEQSGSMRYYTRRSILRWEAASPAALAAAIAALDSSARPVYVVLDAWEEEPFRKKLGAVVPLDWPPLAEAGSSHRTCVWRLLDRDLFHRGEQLTTIRLP